MNLKLLRKSNILVIGDVMLDRYLYGTVDRVSPEAPVPVLKPNKEEIRLGGAANVALNLSSLGSKVNLVGISGKDSASKQIFNLLKENKIKNSLIKSNLPTITKLRLISSKQQLLRLDNEEEFTKEDWKSTKKKFDESNHDKSFLFSSSLGNLKIIEIHYFGEWHKYKFCDAWHCAWTPNIIEIDSSVEQQKKAFLIL